MYSRPRGPLSPLRVAAGARCASVLWEQASSQALVQRGSPAEPWLCPPHSRPHAGPWLSGSSSDSPAAGRSPSARGHPRSVGLSGSRWRCCRGSTVWEPRLRAALQDSAERGARERRPRGRRSLHQVTGFTGEALLSPPPGQRPALRHVKQQRSISAKDSAPTAVSRRPDPHDAPPEGRCAMHAGLQHERRAQQAPASCAAREKACGSGGSHLAGTAFHCRTGWHVAADALEPS